MNKKHNKSEPNELSPLQEIILATLATTEEGLSGYTLTQLLGPVWAASHQQIYRELNKLADLELAKWTYVPQNGKPDRKDYSITEAGFELYELLKNEIPESVTLDPQRCESLSKLALGNWAYFEVLVEKLNKQIAWAKELLEDEHTVYSTPYGKLLVERNLSLWEGELEFATKALAFTTSAAR
ncbi:TPA: PadR family transcriptional regulator [Vibrio diabolicus]